MFTQDNDPERGRVSVGCFKRLLLHSVILQNTPKALAIENMFCEWFSQGERCLTADRRHKQGLVKFNEVHYSMKYLLTIWLQLQTVTAQTQLHDLFLYQDKFMHNTLDNNTSLNLILDSVTQCPFCNYDFTSQLLC